MTQVRSAAHCVKVGHVKVLLEVNQGVHESILTEQLTYPAFS